MSELRFPLKPKESPVLMNNSGPNSTIELNR